LIQYDPVCGEKPILIGAIRSRVAARQRTLFFDRPVTLTSLILSADFRFRSGLCVGKVKGKLRWTSPEFSGVRNGPNENGADNQDARSL
jgi:hypothetical protein